MLISIGNADLGARFGLPLKSTLARASSIAVGHIATPVMDRRRPAIQGNLHTPSALTSSGRNSNKCSHVDSSLKSVSSDQSQFADLAKSAQTIKLASIEMKRQRMEHEMVQAHQKMEHEMVQAREKDQFAAEERALTLKQQSQKEELLLKHQLQEKELAYRERMLQLEVELARLKSRQAPSLMNKYHPTNAYPSNADHFTFPLPSTDWGLPGPSVLK